MILEIVTPEATLLHSEVSSVTVPGIVGEFQMLTNHAPIVSLLVKGKVTFAGTEVKIEKEFASKFSSEKGAYSLAINGGTVEVKENKIIVLAD